MSISGVITKTNDHLKDPNKIQATKELDIYGK